MKIFGGLLALAAFSSAQDVSNERRKNNKNKKNNNRGKYASKVSVYSLICQLETVSDMLKNIFSGRSTFRH